VGVPLSACEGEARSGGGGRVLVAYFSRPGENWWIGGRRDLEVGNTEVLVRAIRARLDCDVHRIRAADPYPDDYDATVRRNVREQDADARPPIANPWHPSTGTTCRGARIGAGLAVRGERAGSAGAEVDAWLREAGLRR
jgi:hypothetical protein